MDISYSAATIDKLDLSKTISIPSILVSRDLQRLPFDVRKKSVERYPRLSRRIRKVSQKLSWRHSAESSSRNLISSYFTFALARFSRFSPPSKQ